MTLPMAAVSAWDAASALNAAGVVTLGGQAGLLTTVATSIRAARPSILTAWCETSAAPFIRASIEADSTPILLGAYAQPEKAPSVYTASAATVSRPSVSSVTTNAKVSNWIIAAYAASLISEGA
jgi:hypothetical protein